MAKRIVKEYLSRPGGRSYRTSSGQITVELRTTAWADGGHREILSRVAADVDATGLMTVELDVNADLDPPGTYYTIRLIAGRTHAIIVPAGVGDLWLRDCLVVDPPAAPPFGVVLPVGGVPGQVLGILPDGTLGWLTPTSGGSGSPNLIFGAGVYGAGVYSPAA